MTAISTDEPAPPIAWNYTPLGEGALLVQGQASGPAEDIPHSLVNRYMLALAAALETHQPRGMQAAVPAINSLLLSVDPLVLSLAHAEAYLQRLLAELEPVPEQPARVVSIPVVYGGAGGPDLTRVAATLGLTPRQVVAEHCAHVYRVMMIGFTPGFPYAGPLPPSLSLPRRDTPRAAVPAGSVGIAAGLSGVYPARLPGGWHLIGSTSTVLFDPTANPPSLLQAGDGVRFTAEPDGVTP